MNFITSTDSFARTTPATKHLALIRILLAGLVFPLGFAPFHLPGLAIASIAIFYHALLKTPRRQAFVLGLTYGLGCFGSGVSWVIISIHDYGQLNYLISGFITLLFILYLAIFPATLTLGFKYLRMENRKYLDGFLFAALWMLGEFVRARLFTGFPWLQLGVSQLDTPLAALAPITGIYGLSFLCCFASTLLVTSLGSRGIKQHLYLMAFVLIIISPSLLKNKDWTSLGSQPLSVGIIQANLSMRNKWDERLFWDLLEYYKQATKKLLGTELIVMPESAIPLPSSYVADYLSTMDSDAKAAGSAVLLGLLHPLNPEGTQYANAVLALGNAEGKYIKQHLVPFGEYIPGPFSIITEGLGLPDPGILPGTGRQALISVAAHPVANLICYEIAYPSLLRPQLPQAEWIISNSDNGWFGHSLASYQQLQMAAMLSLMTGRYQVLSNNDGLSSVIDNHGRIVQSLPPFSAGILKSRLFPATGSTPWIIFGDTPWIIFAFFFLISVFPGKESLND